MKNGITNSVKSSNRVYESKIALLTASSTARPLVSMSECYNDKKIRYRTGLVIIRLTKIPRDPGSSHWSTRVKDAVRALRFLAVNSTKFFSPFLVLRLLTVSVTVTIGGG